MNRNKAMEMTLNNIKKVDVMSEQQLFDFITKCKHLNKIIYTFLHRKEIKRICEEKGIEWRRYKLHDIDKIINLLFGLSPQEVKKIHRIISPHHRDYLDRDVIIEKLLDWESARFTKLDKPLSAYQYLIESNEKWIFCFLPIIREFNFTTGYEDFALTEEEYLLKVKSVTIGDIIDDLKEALD